MTSADLTSITADYYANMAALRSYTLAQGKFAWQLLWTGGGDTSVGNTCPSPLVREASCAADLAGLCSAASPAQTRTMMYAFYPGGCKGNPANLTQFDQVGVARGAVRGGIVLCECAPHTPSSPPPLLTGPRQLPACPRPVRLPRARLARLQPGV